MLLGMSIQHKPVIRYCGDAKIRVRFTGYKTSENGTGYDVGRPMYAGSISFPNGKRWPFRDLSPSPMHLRCSATEREAYDVATGSACGFCGYMGDDNHNQALSDAMWGYGDYKSPDCGDTVYRIKRSPKGKIVLRIV